MTLLEAIVLGIVQGLTEFLPISSTAHLIIVPDLLGWERPTSGFSAVIQCGTLVAVIAYFRRDIGRIVLAVLGELRAFKPASTPDGKMGWMIVLGTIPIVICGVLFEKWIDRELRSLYVISASLILLALLLMAAECLVRWRDRRQMKQRVMGDLNWGDALGVGLAQAVALIPGSSRSGTSITGGLFLGMNRETAARFSFLLSLPAIFAAGMYKLYKERQELLGSDAGLVNLIVCTLVSAVVGYAAIAFLLGYLRRHSTWLFIVYRLVLGAGLLALLALGKLNPT